MSELTLFTIIGATIALFLLIVSFILIRDKYGYNEETEYRNSPYINPATNLPKDLENVLDLYEQSNIRVPQDVLEDVINMQLQDEMEIYSYIENQRHYWKMENGKKPYKKPNQ